jgi:hypothetical protein
LGRRHGYLKANYAVPTYELARDPRVVEAGLNFNGRVPPTPDWDSAWARVEAYRVTLPSAPIVVEGKDLADREATGGEVTGTFERSASAMAIP